MDGSATAQEESRKEIWQFEIQFVQVETHTRASQPAVIQTVWVKLDPDSLVLPESVILLTFITSPHSAPSYSTLTLLLLSCFSLLKPILPPAVGGGSGGVCMWRRGGIYGTVQCIKRPEAHMGVGPDKGGARHGRQLSLVVVVVLLTP